MKEQADELEKLASIIGTRHFDIIIGKEYAKEDLKQAILRAANI